MAKYLDYDGLLYFYTKLKDLFAGKVDKVEGKGLSTNDYTTAEKTKLDGIASGAEVNQNAFGKIIVGTTALEADSKVDTLTVSAGANITLTPNAANDTFTIAAKNTTYAEATTTAAGLLSAADKTKLDGVATGATANTGTITGVSANGTSVATSGVANIPAATTSKYGVTQLSSATNSTSTSLAATASAVKAAYDLAASKAAKTNATTAAAGLMSAADKTKLDGFGDASNYALKSDITAMYKYKGSVATVADLPATNNTAGDVYNVEATGMNYAWTGKDWDALGQLLDIGTVSNTDIDTIVAS